MDISIKEITAVIGISIALFTFIKTAIEYRHQGSLRRVELFSEKQNHIWTNDKFRKILINLEKNNEEDIENIPTEDKMALLFFLKKLL